MIDRMLVVVFDTESKAYEGKKALLQLENEGSIGVYAYAVVAKNADGTATVRQGDDPGPLGTLVGTSLGSLIGLLGGPVGLAIGASVGLVAGSAADLNNARVGGDFIDDVTKVLLPNRVAVVAEIQEDWTTPVDIRMEAIGGTVFRRALSDVKDTVDDEEIAAMKADFAQMKAEHAKARADRKAKLQEKINQLDSKIQTRLERAKERRQAAEQQAKARGPQGQGSGFEGQGSRDEHLAPEARLITCLNRGGRTGWPYLKSSMEGGKYDRRDQDEQWEREVHGQFNSGPDPARHWLSPNSGNNQGNASRLDSGCCRYHVVYLARLLPYNMVRYDLQEGDSSVSAAVVAGRSFQTGK